MTDVAFIGLVIMGPNGHHLQHAGFPVSGYNRRRDRSAPLNDAGGDRAASIADAPAGADIVALMVPNSHDVQKVLLCDGGVFASANPGALVIDFSSIRPDITRELAAIGKERGLRMLDAPVSGGESGAQHAVLSIMVGGDSSDFVSARPIFDALGSTDVHVGGNGAGQTVKSGASSSSVRISKRSRRHSSSWRPTTSTHPQCSMSSIVEELLSAVRANGDGGLDQSAPGAERLAGRAIN